MPIFCEEVFTGIDEKKQGGDEGQYEVHFSSIICFCNVILTGAKYCDVQQLELTLSHCVNKCSLTHPPVV